MVPVRAQIASVIACSSVFPEQHPNEGLGSSNASVIDFSDRSDQINSLDPR